MSDLDEWDNFLKGGVKIAEERDSLRASLAALKAENEAAVKNMAALQSELAAFKNWQPSDPGTKEVMAFADALTVVSGPPARVKVLAHALRAAMVRLEEAEKGRDANAKQALHFESLYLMERDKAEAAEDALDKERLRDGI